MIDRWWWWWWSTELAHLVRTLIPIHRIVRKMSSFCAQCVCENASTNLEVQDFCQAARQDRARQSRQPSVSVESIFWLPKQILITRFAPRFTCLNAVMVMAVAGWQLAVKYLARHLKMTRKKTNSSEKKGKARQIKEKKLKYLQYQVILLQLFYFI